MSAASLRHGGTEGIAVRPVSLVEAGQGARAGVQATGEADAVLRRLPRDGGGSGRAADALGCALDAYSVEMRELGDDARRLVGSVAAAAVDYVGTESRVVARGGGP